MAPNAPRRRSARAENLPRRRTVRICKISSHLPPHPENYGGNPPEFRSKIN
jgi:hypothetical protein